MSGVGKGERGEGVVIARYTAASIGIGSATGGVIGAVLGSVLLPGAGTLGGAVVGAQIGSAISAAVGGWLGFRSSAKMVKTRQEDARRTELIRVFGPAKGAQERYVRSLLTVAFDGIRPAAVAELKSRIKQERETTENVLRRLEAARKAAESGRAADEAQFAAERAPFDAALADADALEAEAALLGSQGAAAAAEIRGYPGLRPAAAAIAAQRERYAATMSIALVGRVSSGKSTLANALLACPYAATGISELTCNVTSLRYGPRPELTVHFTDGRRAEKRDRAELLALSALDRHDPALRDYLAAISYLEMRDPNAWLRTFDLVDTPGLDAASGSEHVRKTLEFLGRPDGSLREATVSFASRADALVLVFPRTPSATDAEVVGEFVRAGLGAANPITAVGALTKTELDWPEHDPVVQGRVDAERLMRAPAGRSLVFEIVPVAGKLAAAAGVLSAEDHADLESLSRLPAATLKKRLGFAPGFGIEPHPDLPLSGARRVELFEQFSGYGVALAWRAAAL